MERNRWKFHGLKHDTSGKSLKIYQVSYLRGLPRTFMAAGLHFRVWELICYCFIFVVGLIGNLTVCLVVLKSGPSFRRFRLVPFNIYLMSLAIVDLTLAIVCLPVYVMSTAIFPHPTGTKGDIFCKTITGYLLPFWLGGVSVYLLVIISFERYTAVCKPFLAMTRQASKTTALYVAGAWLIGFTIQLPTIIGVHFTQSKPPTSTGNFCAFKWQNKTTVKTIYAFILTFEYVVPAVIFLVNFYRIKKCLTKLDGNLKRSIEDAGQRKIVMKSKKKTVRIVFVVSAAYFLCWTPTNVMYFLFQYGELEDITWNSNFYQAGMILGFSNSCINPFLYAFQSREFRAYCEKVLKKLFEPKCFARQPRSIEGTSTQSRITYQSLPNSELDNEIQ